VSEGFLELFEAVKDVSFKLEYVATALFSNYQTDSY